MNSQDDQVMSKFYYNIKRVRRQEIESGDEEGKNYEYQSKHNPIKLIEQNSAESSKVMNSSSSCGDSSRSSSSDSSCNSISSIESTQKYNNLTMKSSIKDLNILKVEIEEQSISDSKSFPTEPNSSSVEQFKDLGHNKEEKKYNKRKLRMNADICTEFKSEGVSEVLGRKNSQNKSINNDIMFSQASEFLSCDSKDFSNPSSDQIKVIGVIDGGCENKENAILESDERKEYSYNEDINFSPTFPNLKTQKEIVIDLKASTESKDRYGYKQVDQEPTTTYGTIKVNKFKRRDRKRISLDIDSFVDSFTAKQTPTVTKPKLEINTCKYQALKIEDYLADEPWNSNEYKKHPNIKEDLDKLKLDSYSTKKSNMPRKECKFESISSINKDKEHSIIDICAQESSQNTPTVETSTVARTSWRSPDWAFSGTPRNVKGNTTSRVRIKFNKLIEMIPEQGDKLEMVKEKQSVFNLEDCDVSEVVFPETEFQCNWAERAEITNSTHGSVC
ncbi:unnamed protein product [Moneuplotes crassus]|uniref:Uncharacterized protein n=1 Tax=Euplotes crassus TaxID=5936 RepID=A0AAD1X9T8_EUPCR|nr:unnamed protein product [Moneuplotes crassus]